MAKDSDMLQMAGVEEDYADTERGQWKRWSMEVELSEKNLRNWHDRAEQVIDRYRDQPDSQIETTNGRLQHSRFNIFWSNVQTLQPALYARVPQPEVARRFKDSDPVGRLAAELLERSTDFCVDEKQFDPVMQMARDDWLIPGLGQAWIIYEPKFQTVDSKVQITEEQLPMLGVEGTEFEEYSPEDVEMKEDGMFASRSYEEIEYEEVKLRYIPWKDFLWSPAKTWDDVRWVAKRVYMTRRELIEAFGEEKGKEIPLSHNVDKDSSSYDEDEGLHKDFFAKAKIYEIWDKTSRKVYWLCDEYEGLLDEQEDPLKLTGFFPCPKPLLATTTSGSLVPIPDYIMYQDQAVELDDLTARIDMLLKTVKVFGIYDASIPELERLILETSDNDMIPHPNWPMVQQAGGLKGVMDFMPLENIVGTLQQLIQAREQIKRDLYEITGMADIVRGAGDPRETATAQQIKGRFANLRLGDRQREMQRFARDCIALMAEVIAEHFQPETIALMAGADLMNTPDGQYFPQAIELLRNDKLRTFRVDIETDSTIAIDEEIEKQKRTEFLTAVSQFFGSAMPIAQSSPEMVPLLGEMLLFGVRGFKAGRQLEASIEDAVEKTRAAADAPKPPPPPNPVMVKLQQDMQIKQEEMKLDMSKMQSDAQGKAAELQQKQQQQQAELQFKYDELNQASQDQQASFALKQAELQAEIGIEIEKLKEALLSRQDDLVKTIENRPTALFSAPASKEPPPPPPPLPPARIDIDLQFKPQTKIITLPNGNTATIESLGDDSGSNFQTLSVDQDSFANGEGGLAVQLPVAAPTKVITLPSGETATIEALNDKPMNNISISDEG